MLKARLISKPHLGLQTTTGLDYKLVDIVMLKLQCPLEKCSFSFRLQTSAVILGISCFVGLCTFGVDIWHVKVINGLPVNMELVC
jgi:hypothetical protein